MDPKFILALEPRVLKLGGSSFGIRPYIYILKECYKVAITMILRGAFSPPPVLNFYSETSCHIGLWLKFFGPIGITILKWGADQPRKRLWLKIVSQKVVSQKDLTSEKPFEGFS